MSAIVNPRVDTIEITLERALAIFTILDPRSLSYPLVSLCLVMICESEMYLAPISRASRFESAVLPVPGVPVIIMIDRRTSQPAQSFISYLFRTESPYVKAWLIECSSFGLSRQPKAPTFSVRCSRDEAFGMATTGILAISQFRAICVLVLPYFEAT